MPIIVQSEHKHPFLPSIGHSSAIEVNRALHQDIRPLEIVIFNMMADKVATERQLAFWLGTTSLQINLTFATTDSYVDQVRAGWQSKNTPAAHIHNFYSPWREIKDKKHSTLLGLANALR